MPAPQATVFVCTSCRRPLGTGDDGEELFDLPGTTLVDRLCELTTADQDISVVPIECLAVCTRACTLALIADGKWTYVVGDIDPDDHAPDVAEMARAYSKTTNGIVAWRARPEVFRKGVVARVPPALFRPPKEAAE